MPRQGLPRGVEYSEKNVDVAGSKRQTTRLPHAMLEGSRLRLPIFSASDSEGNGRAKQILRRFVRGHDLLDHIFGRHFAGTGGSSVGVYICIQNLEMLHPYLCGMASNHSSSAYMVSESSLVYKAHSNRLPPPSHFSGSGPVVSLRASASLRDSDPANLVVRRLSFADIVARRSMPLALEGGLLCSPVGSIHSERQV